MAEDIRIFSYLPNPRVWKSLITAKFGNVKLKVIGDKPMSLTNWLWDFDAQELTSLDSEEMKSFKRKSKRGFKGNLYKTDMFLEKHPFGTVPAGFNSDGSIGIFESNSIMRAVARSSDDLSLYGGNDSYMQSRIDSFLDANLIFAREFQVYTLEIDSLNDYLHHRMTSAYLFYMDGIEKALSNNEFIAGKFLTIADISFVCDLAQFLRERDKIEIINNQGYDLITLNFEEEFPNAYLHLKKLAIHEKFKELLLKYLEKVIKIS